MLVYVSNNSEYVGVMEGTLENIAHLIGGASPYDNYKIVDEFDNLIASSTGFYLDQVPNQEWLAKELLPLIQQVQFEIIPLKEIEIVKI